MGVFVWWETDNRFVVCGQYGWTDKESVIIDFSTVLRLVAIRVRSMEDTYRAYGEDEHDETLGRHGQ